MSDLDFSAERAFVAVAKRHLSALQNEVITGSVYDDYAPIDRLGEICDHAQAAQARAVLTCARRCQDIARTSPLDQAFELRTLSRLVGQFETGLLEIDPYASAETELAVETPTQPIDNNQAGPSVADTLGELIQFAPAENQDALGALLRLSGAKLPMAETETPLTAVPLVAPVFVSLESLMEPITNTALSSAHRGFKQVSLSYACEGVKLSKSVAVPLGALLGALCDVIVRQSVRHPGVREGAGLPATSQIAITASDTSSGLSLDIFCDDQPLQASAFQGVNIMQALTAFRLCGGSFTSGAGRKSGVLLGISHPTPLQSLQPKPAKQTVRAAESQKTTADTLSEALA